MSSTTPREYRDAFVTRRARSFSSTEPASMVSTAMLVIMACELRTKPSAIAFQSQHL